MFTPLNPKEKTATPIILTPPNTIAPCLVLYVLDVIHSIRKFGDFLSTQTLLCPIHVKFLLQQRHLAFFNAKIATKMYRISKNQLAKKNDFMRKNGILKIHQDDRACRNFLLDICPELCDMYILYYYYEIHDEKTNKTKTNYEFYY